MLEIKLEEKQEMGISKHCQSAVIALISPANHLTEDLGLKIKKLLSLFHDQPFGPGLNE